MDIRGKDLIVAVGGGILFMAIWILLEILFTSDTTLIGGIIAGIAGGVAWFAGTLYFRHLRRESGADES